MIMNTCYPFISISFLRRHCYELTEWGAKVMKKQLVILGIIAILVSVGLSGCNEKKRSQ